MTGGAAHCTRGRPDETTCSRRVRTCDRRRGALYAGAPALSNRRAAGRGRFDPARVRARNYRLVPADPPPAPADSTDALVEACLQGDQAAWETIVRRYRRKVFNVAYTFVGRHEEAEDLTQDVFLKIFRALGTFDRRANFTTWIISVSRNLCIDHYRRVRKEREVVDHRVDASELAPIAGGVDAFARLVRFDRRALLREALAALPETLRTAVAMRDLQELSYQEIAGRLGLPDGTVKSRINRGRHELARQVLRIERARRADAPPRARETTVTP